MTENYLPDDEMDLYLRGELDGEHLSAFEERLKTDPALKAELERHQSLVQGLATYRKSQLKTMLQNTPIVVGVGVGLSMWQTQWVQWALATAGAGAMVTGIWVATKLGGGGADKAKPASQITANTPATETPVPATQEVVPTPEPTTEPTKAESMPPAEPKASENIPKKPTESAPEKPVVIPNTQPANMPDGNDAVLSGNDHPSAPNTNVVSNPEAASAVSETVVKTDSRYPQHYQFNDGKLFLYGKFDKGLYEVLDLSGKNGKRSFVYYQSTYYEIIPGTTSISPLQACQDKAVVANLDKLRKTK